MHRQADGRTTLYELLERDDLKPHGYIVPQSVSTITKILEELGYIHPKIKQPHRLLELPAPIEESKMDFAEICFSSGLLHRCRPEKTPIGLL